MPRYRRILAPGGTYFFTVATHKRRHIFSDKRAVALLRSAWRRTMAREPFETIAFCLLPDHFHCIVKLPAEDAAFSGRLALIKATFSRNYKRHMACFPQSPSRQRQRLSGVWQKRFWEHLVRDEDDLVRHVDYIHYNPVKHGLVTRAAEWPWSTFHRYVRKGIYRRDWGQGPEEWMLDLVTARE